MIERPALTARERRVIGRLRTPLDVQRYLNALPYNTEPHGRATLRSFRGVVAHGNAHCLEATLFAAVVLEHHGYPPLVLSFESIDLLDHVIFVYRTSQGWGSVARSRDPGLHGRKPVFATPRALALSYQVPYVDFTGAIKAYAVVDLRVLGRYDWRLSTANLWKVEQMLLNRGVRRPRLLMAVGAVGVRRVLHHEKLVPAADPHQRIHVRRQACEVDRDDRPGSGRDGGLDGLRIQVERPQIDVRKHRHGIGLHHRRRRR